MYPEAKPAQTFTVEDSVLKVPKVDFNNPAASGASGTNQ
jgi:hypothetical protein